MRNIVRLVVAALGAFAITSALAQETDNVMHLSDNSGLYTASLKGDQQKLLAIASTSTGGPDVIAKALYLRSTYQLAESSKIVTACADPSQIAHSTANWSCALILAGNKLLGGDVSGWARLMAITKKIVTPLLAARAGSDPQNLHVDEFEAVSDFSKYVDFPALSVTRTAAQFSLPIGWVPSADSSDSIHPFLNVIVNGHAIRMALDTGTSGVILNRHDAVVVELTDIHYGWMNTSQGGTTDLGVAKTFSIGKVSIANMPITITDAPVSVIGIRGLQFLGAIRLHGDMLDVSDEGFGDTCQSPMNMASWVEGSNNVLLVPGQVQNKPFLFFLDTGNAWDITRHMFGQPSAQDQAKPISLSTGGVARTTLMSEAHDTMRIGNGSSSYQHYRVVYSDQHTRFRYDIGAGYVYQHDLTIDFVGGHLCLN